jgi:23S rRNA (adenine2503-C2)-methyltransferase
MLLGMDLTELQGALGGAPAFRAKQLYDALYRQRVETLEAVTALPAAMRNGLAIGNLTASETYMSADATTRYLLSLPLDGKTVETVLMPDERRDTLCISSQVGCPVDCQFCLTAKMGLERNLTAGEIVGQVLYVCSKHGLDPKSQHVNIVMMGMGEPLLNLKNVIKATKIICDDNGVGFSPRRMTISTSGIIPKIEELGKEVIRPKLAISLNASTEEQRREIMPITRKYHLADLLEVCRAFPLKPREHITFEYVLLGGVNDSIADAKRVAKMLANIRAKVNLIALNPGPGIPYAIPSEEKVASFHATVMEKLPCFVRKPRGRDIYAACGQLKKMAAAEFVQIH